MSTDQIQTLLDTVQQVQANLFIIRHLVDFVIGLLLAWVCFHD